MPPGGYGSPEYKKIVPAGNLPALKHNDLLLADSEAIAEYLNEKFPVPEMLPGDVAERAKLRERSRFHDTRLEPALRALFSHIAAAKRDDDFVAHQWSVLREKLVQLEPLLPGNLNALTLADCGIAVTCIWIEELAQHFVLSPILNERLRVHLDALSKFQAVSMELADYRPRLTSWLADQ